MVVVDEVMICWRSDRGYLSHEFKKEITPTFDGEMRKPLDAVAWFFGMRLHHYS